MNFKRHIFLFFQMLHIGVLQIKDRGMLLAFAFLRSR